MNLNEINELYKKSCDIILPYIRLEGRKSEQVDFAKKEEILKEGLEGLETVLKFNPSNWSARWMIGKIKQVLGLHEEAYNAFLIAHRGVLTNENVMRELALECLQTKRFKQAVHYCHVAIEFAPDDYSLFANMAVSQLFNGNLIEAESWAKKSLEKIPNDPPSNNILKIIEDIKKGNRPIPDDFTLLEKE